MAFSLSANFVEMNLGVKPFQAGGGGGGSGGGRAAPHKTPDHVITGWFHGGLRFRLGAATAK